MPTELSSSLTFFYKVVFPSVWIAVFGVASITLLWVRSANFPWAIFPMMWVFGSAMIYWFCGRLKKVTTDKDGLAISNYVREIRVGWHDIGQVTGSRIINPPHITVVFRHEMSFGTSIIFMPKMRFLWPFQEHPAAQELRDLVRMHQSVGN